MRRPAPRQVVRLVSMVEHTANVLDSKELKHAALDIADAYAACRVYCDCIDELTRLSKGSRRKALRIISETRAWVKSELVPHGRKLDRLLEAIALEL